MAISAGGRSPKLTQPPASHICGWLPSVTLSNVAGNLGNPLASMGKSMGKSSSFPLKTLVIFPWIFFPWIFHGFSMIFHYFPWIFHYFPWIFHYFPWFSWIFHGHGWLPFRVSQFLWIFSTWNPPILEIFGRVPQRLFPARQIAGRIALASHSIFIHFLQVKHAKMDKNGQVPYPFLLGRSFLKHNNI